MEQFYPYLFLLVLIVLERILNGRNSGNDNPHDDNKKN